MGELLLLAAKQVKRMSFPRTATVVSGWMMICGLGKSSKRKQQAWLVLGYEERLEQAKRCKEK